MEKSISRMIGDINGSVFKNLDNYQVSIQLKYILEKKLPVVEFIKWFLSTSENLAKYNLNLFDFFCRLEFLRNNCDLCTIFFKYLKVIGNMNLDIYSIGNKQIPLSSKAFEIINRNKLGPIAFVAPELGRWSTVGGLGIMVDELSQGLVHLGEDVIVISPYYEKNRKGESGYLSRDPVEFKHIGNIDVTLDKKFTFGVHHGVCNGVKLYFLHNCEIFPSPYAEGSVSFVLRQICLFSKASLELLCFIKSVPAVILTNDWFGAMTPAYSKCGHFGDTFKGTTFFHIVHNLEAGYEGRLYPAINEGTLDYIHKLPVHCLVDPFWKAKVINPSRCALLMSDQWGTVSPSYRKDLCETSPMAPLLNNHKKPFAFPNGIFRAQRIKALEQKAGTSHLEAKKALQKKYFNFQDADYSIPLYSFVGRITLQKGVLLILDCAETLINRANGKINIIVGGMGNMKDPYVIQCVNKINYLRHKYPHNFWANPNEFFTDGPLINLGSDFGLMPSLFEPGGIVQHEFFIAGTPVIAFRTGGLKDTVVEFDWLSQCGNGIVFSNHNFNDFVNAVDRSMTLFKNQELYNVCRQNSFVSAIDVLEVSQNWNKEFYRLRDKVFYNINESDNMKEFTHVSAEEMKECLSKFNYKDYVFLKESEKNNEEREKEDIEYPTQRKNSNTTTVIDGEVRIPITFTYTSDLQIKPSSVQICGSFDKWQVRHPLTFDPLYNKWSVTLKIRKGTHYFKFIVDGEWVISKSEKTMKDSAGYINNFITI